MKSCCEDFSRENKAEIIVIGTGGDHKKHWFVNGCCGGQCAVLNDIQFCPFCGTKLNPIGDTEGDTWE